MAKIIEKKTAISSGDKDMVAVSYYKFGTTAAKVSWKNYLMLITFSVLISYSISRIESYLFSNCVQVVTVRLVKEHVPLSIYNLFHYVFRNQLL